VLLCLVEVKTLARVILVALWLLAASLSVLCPGESVAQKLTTLEFTQMLQISRVLLLKKLACDMMLM
jgi:hypothetical protein